MQHPILVGAVQAGLTVEWWDPLAALSSTTHGLVQYEWKRIAVIQDGVSSGRFFSTAPETGRTIESPTGNLMRVGMPADTALFVQRLIDVLNGTASHGAPSEVARRRRPGGAPR